MSSVTIGFLVGGSTLALLAVRTNCGMAMLKWGLDRLHQHAAGLAPLMSYFKHLACYSRFSVYDLSAVPLFLLMGNIASHRRRQAPRLFEATNAFPGHYRGGVAMSAIRRQAASRFAFPCSPPRCGGRPAPLLRRNRYSPAFRQARDYVAGGTLGILIPPSVVLVIYAIAAEQNVAAMFHVAFVLEGLDRQRPGRHAPVVAIYARVVPDYVRSASRARMNRLPQRWRWPGCGRS